MPDLEGLGDAATGALLAGAVEPKTGQTADGHTHERDCRNQREHRERMDWLRYRAAQRGVLL